MTVSEQASFVARHCADQCTADDAGEEVDLEERGSPTGSPTHGKHRSARTIPRELATKDPITSPGQLFERVKEVKGFHNKKDLAMFEVGRFHTPWLRRGVLTATLPCAAEPGTRDAYQGTSQAASGYRVSQGSAYGGHCRPPT